MPVLGFDQVPLGILTTVRIVLRRILQLRAPEALVLLKDESGSVLEKVENMRLIVGVFCSHPSCAEMATPSFCLELVQLLQVVPELMHDEVSGDAIERAAETIQLLADDLEALAFGDMAYNLAEYSYHLSDLIKQPCLKAASSLRRLADVKNLDQYYSALWRYATQTVRASVEDASLRIEAIDASELAWTVYAPSEDLQRKLCDDYFSTLQLIIGTPVEALAMVYPVEVDDRFISAEIRRQCISILNERTLALDAPETVRQAAHLLAVMKAQCTLDDARHELIGLSPDMPSISWNNLLLRHGKLVNAVPLRRSLIVDVMRTGEFAMQLAHELTHAFCLIGPIGWANAAFRSAIRNIEAAIQQRGGTPEQLNADDLSVNLAERQLFAAMCEAEQESAWTPWLEGVAQYLELLADPTENEKQIITVHAALRSLIDPDKKEGVSPSESFDQMAREFDQFLSRAIKRLSYPRHRGYTHPFIGPLRYSYFLGYLLVRGVVARWEVTLGRRILPVDAAKVLVLVTQGATESVDWGMDASGEDAEIHASSEFERWFDLILCMSRESLELVLTSPEKDSPGQAYRWDRGKPIRMTIQPTDEEIDLSLRSWTQINHKLVSLLANPMTFRNLSEGQIDEARDLVKTMAEPLLETLRKSVESRTLLPVGREMARVVLLDRGRVVICPRTYVGLAKPSDSAGLPRYSVRSIPLKGQAAEVEELRKAFGRNGTARLLLTRIVDLMGDPKSPLRQPSVSYVCMLLGKDWHLVSFGDNLSPIEVKPEFLDAISLRLAESVPTEAKWSHLDSLRKLAARLFKADPASDAALRAREFEGSIKSRDRSIKVLSTRWGIEPSRLIEAVDTLFADTLLRDGVAKYLYETGRGTMGKELPNSFPLSPMVFDAKCVSGIKPLGGH